MLATPEALFIGFQTRQPVSMRRHGRSPRDAEFMDADELWYSAVSEDEAGRSIEVELPWSVAPMGPVTGGRRQIGIYVGLLLQTTSEKYTFPGNDYRGPTFAADLRPIKVPAYDASLRAWRF